MTSRGGILALDIATRVGWAVCSPDAAAAWPRMPSEARARADDPPRILHGVQQLAPVSRSDGALFAAFDNWLADMVTVHQPRWLFFEAPLLKAKGRKTITAKNLIGLSASAERVGYVRELRVRTLHYSTVKKHFTGDGHAQKPAMVAEAKARGYVPHDDNAADAIAVLDRAISDLREAGKLDAERAA